MCEFSVLIHHIEPGGNCIMQTQKSTAFRLLAVLIIAAMIFGVVPATSAKAATPGQTLYVANWTAPATVGVNGRPIVIKDGATYHLWYGASDTALYHSTSETPASFGAGTLTTYNTGFAPIEVGSPAIIKEGGLYYMITYRYASRPIDATLSTPANNIFSLYSSSDGNSWTYIKDVFDCTVFPAGTYNKFDAPFLFKDGSKFRLYFQLKSADKTTYRIYTAETEQAITDTEFAFNLVNSGNPVLEPGSGTWDGKLIMHAWVIKDNGTYFMYYTGGVATGVGIGVAKSTDGYSWVKSSANPILAATGESVVIKDGDTWRMWYLGSEAGGPVKYFTSTGPIEFSTIQAAVNAAAAGDTVSVAPGTYNEENILIKKALTLQGAGAATTFIAPSATTNNSTIIVNNPTGDVLIDGFTFVMQPKPNYGSAVAVTGKSIAVDSATVTISNNVVNGSNDGSKSDYGFYGQGNHAKLVITNNVINKTGDNSICMEQQVGSTIVSNNTIYITDNVDYNPYFSMTYGGTIVTTPQIVEGNTFYLDHAGTGWSEAITFVAAYFGKVNNDPSDVGGYRDVQIRNNTINGGGERARGIGIFDNSHADGQGTISGVVISGNSFLGENATDPTTIGIYLSGDVESALIKNNRLNGVITGIQLLKGLKNNVLPSGNIIENNQITNTGTALIWEGTALLDASPNWWGSIAGPAAGKVSGLVTFAPWCTNEACTTFAPTDGKIILPAGVTAAEIQTAINNAPEYTTIVIPAETYSLSGGFIINNPHLTILLKNGTIIKNESPCFIINADFTQITAETLGNAKCVPTNGSNGIDVAADLKDIRIIGLEIDGTDATGSGDGIHFAGAVSDVLIDDNIIHDLDKNGINFTVTPAATVEIKGNLIKGNALRGVAAPADLDVKYNSWGKMTGPVSGTDVSAVITSFAPFTHAELSLVSSGTPWTDHVLPGNTITYTVTADFKLKYPAGLTLGSVTNVTAAFQPVPTSPTAVLVDTSAPGIISFAGYTTTAVSGHVALFDITFTAPAMGGVLDLNLDETSSIFVMSPGYGASNNIYANALFDAQLDVITALPTMTAQDLDADFAATYPQEFSLTITNPADGVIFDTPQLQYSLPAGTVLEYYNGSGWVTLADPLDLPALAVGSSQTLVFRIAFPLSANSQTVTFNLVDTHFTNILATLSQTVTVNPLYTVTGTFSMQGRSVRSGIPVELTMITPALYGPFSGTTIDLMSGNLSITNVAAATYTITTFQPRYLNVTADLEITKTVTADTALAALELKGGNANWSNNAIDVNDASRIGTDWGGDVSKDGDVNFSGKVDIFDLALVGGNLDKSAADFYTVWVP